MLIKYSHRELVLKRIKYKISLYTILFQLPTIQYMTATQVWGKKTLNV